MIWYLIESRYLVYTKAGWSAPSRVPWTTLPEDLHYQAAIRVVEASGAFGDTLLEVPSGGLFEGQGPGLRFFTPEPTWDISDSLTVLFAVNDRYRILFHDRDGTVRRILTRPHEPREITERDIRVTRRRKLM